MQSRVDEFEATFQIPKEHFVTAPACKESWCRWVVADSVRYASSPQLGLPLAPSIRARPLPRLPAADEEKEEQVLRPRRHFV